MSVEAQLVQVDSPGEAAHGEVDVGQDQVGGVHTADRHHPHLWVGGAGAGREVEQSGGDLGERDVGGSDGHRCFQDRVAQVDARVAELKASGGEPVRACAIHPGACRRDGGGLVEDRTVQQQSAVTLQVPIRGLLDRRTREARVT